MNFAKLHALGNDFLVIDPGQSGDIADISGFTSRICDRHTGVGADGVLLISITDRTKGLVNFRIFNADGSEPEISGNGMRCAAAYLFHKKQIEPPRVTFLTGSGERECRLLEQKGNLFRIKTEMGIPKLTSKDIPFDDGSFHQRIIDYPLSIQGKTYPITVVSMGNPHCAVFVSNFPARIEWQQVGREIESHPFFPNRINVEFIRVLNRSQIEVLFWERGVGETLSSGSGSSAAAVASILKDLTDKRVEVKTSMGSVNVEWEKETVYSSAPVEAVFEGSLLS